MRDVALLDVSLKSFWDLCQRTFWGPRAQQKKNVGPADVDAGGGSSYGFLRWLIIMMQEQARRDPAEWQALETMFYGQYRTLFKCRAQGCDWHSQLGKNESSCSITLLREPPWTNNPYEPASFQQGLETWLELRWPPGLHTCPKCKSDSYLSQLHEVINPPEILILGVYRRPDEQTVFWRDTPLTDTLTMSKRYTYQKEDVTYKLNGVIAFTGDSVGDEYSGQWHTINAIRGRDDTWYTVDNDQVNRLPSLKTFDALMRSPVPKNRRRLPSFTLSTIIRDVQQPLSTSQPIKRLSSSLEDESVTPKSAKKQKTSSSLETCPTTSEGTSLVRDLEQCFADLPRSIIEAVLQKHDCDLDLTYRELAFGPSPADPSLNNVDEAIRADVLKLHLQFPHIPVQGLPALLKHYQTLASAIDALQNLPYISLRFNELVGDARVTLSDVNIRPCKQMSALQATGDIEYTLPGSRWIASFDVALKLQKAKQYDLTPPTAGPSAAPAPKRPSPQRPQRPQPTPTDLEPLPTEEEVRDAVRESMPNGVNIEDLRDRLGIKKKLMSFQHIVDAVARSQDNVIFVLRSP